MTIIMILVTIRMKVSPEKRLELSQTISLLSGPIRMAKGCRRCDFFQSVEDENQLFLVEEWETREKLIIHQRSEHFRVLRGATNLLEEPYEMTFYTAYHPEGIEAI